MTAFNIVRFRVKPGAEQGFVDAHRNMRPEMKGFVAANLVKTGDRTFCLIGEWRDFQSIADARPQMIGLLDGVRDMLEDLGAGLGVTDPMSGESVARFVVRAKAKQARRKNQGHGKKKAKTKKKAKAKKRKSK